MSFLNKAERKTLTDTDSWNSSDAMAAAVMLWPELALKSVVTNVSPVIDGLARGSVVVDYTNLTSKPKNAKIILSFNTTAFQQLLLTKFS